MGSIGFLRILGDYMSRKINVAVLMGGRSAEHEISLKSGKFIVNALDKSKYNVKPIIITKLGKWLISKGYIDGKMEIKSGAQEPDAVLDFHQGRLFPEQLGDDLLLSAGRAMDIAVEEKVDVVFIAMHGPLGEDGTVQGLLELADIPYTGSNVLASSLAMHKMMSRRLFQLSGLSVPKSFGFTVWEWGRNSAEVISKVKNSFGFPCVLKPMELGSSVGVSIVKTEEGFKDGVLEVLKHSNEVLVEEFLEGQEFTCSVLGAIGGDEPTPLVPTQIIPKTSEFFDYKAKYTPSATEEVTPPRNVSEETIRRLQQTAVCAHKALGCGSMSRTDMIMKDGVIYVLELNTIPGMTEISLYPQAAKAAGISFPELLDRIIQIAIETHRSKKRYRNNT